MPRRRANTTQADIARALRAVQQSGLTMAVEIAPDGTIRLEPVDSVKPTRFDKKVPVRL